MKKQSETTVPHGDFPERVWSNARDYFNWSDSDRCAPTVSLAWGIGSPIPVGGRIRWTAKAAMGTLSGGPSSIPADIGPLLALYEQRQYAEAVALSAQMMDEFQAVGDEAGFAATLFFRGAAQAQIADRFGAKSSLRRANAIYRKLGMPGDAARALAAEGAIGLADPRQGVKNEGAHLIQQAVCIKLGCSDRGGIGRDFMMLSKYALGLKQMSRALGHGRRGVKLSFMQGDDREILMAIENLIDVYVASRLYERANQAAKQALAWAEEIKSEAAISAALQLRVHVKSAQQDRGRHLPKFYCPCETNEARRVRGEKILELKDCCGPADRDPVEVDWGYCLAPQHGAYQPGPDAVAFNLTLGEYVDKEAFGDKPEGFLIARFHDGWLETFGLPHLANYHLKGARAACKAAVDPMDLGFPIAAVLLATCWPAPIRWPRFEVSASSAA